MILTGSEIAKAVLSGDIKLSPFDEKQINPNSYNYRIDNTIKKYVGFEDEKAIFEEEIITEDGYLLEKGVIYLANTKEIIGSDKYAMSLIGRSSLGRNGLFLQISANLGHTTSNHRWTLEIVASIPFIVYPNMKIGQVSFWENKGSLKPDIFTYANFNNPHEPLI